jgi:hypothetical protein
VPTTAIVPTTADFCLFNACSIVNKIDYLALFVYNYNPAVVGICETWLSGEPDPFFCPQGYYVLREDRKSGPRGGVAFIVRNDIQAAKIILPLSYSALELLCADIIFNDNSYRCIICYRPPYYEPADLNYLTNSLQCILQQCTEYNVLLMGDFNLPQVDWIHYHAPNTNFYNSFLKFVNDNALHQYVLEPTRQGNILDLVFANDNTLVSDLQVLDPFGSADHNVINFSINVPCGGSAGNVTDLKYYDFDSADYELIELYLTSINWAYEFSFVFTTEDYWNIFLSHMYNAIQLYVPVKIRAIQMPRNSKKYPRILQQMLNRKAVLWKRWRTTKNVNHKKAYDAYTTKCINAINVHQCILETKLVESNDLGKFYRFVNNKLNGKLPTAPLKDAADNLISDSKEQANIFNKYFATVFTADDGKAPPMAPRIDPHSHISNIDFAPDKILRVLLQLKPSSSSGPDELPNILLKKIAHSVCNPLAFLFDMSFRTHTLPSSWLHAIVTPVFKKGTTSSPSNYRPISLTCVCCRVMERIINRELMDYLLSHHLITKHQHGFLRKHSTCSNLLESVNDWSVSLNSKLTTDIIYIDFQKAFDTVSHKKLIQKIECYGVKGDLLNWIKAFLAYRTLAVKVNGCISAIIGIISGVPQGSVLGPTLFLLFINDITDIFPGLNINFKLFADDVKLYSSFQYDCSADLKDACQRLDNWANTWQLRIALDKCFVQRISNVDSASPCIDTKESFYAIQNKRLAWSTETRDLGVIIDSKLSFNTHISSIAHKSHVRARLILKSFASRNANILVKAFITYVRPLLEYCTPVWSPHTQANIDKIESVQRRFTKRIEGLSSISYPERLKLLGLESLQIRRLKCDLATCFKIITRVIDVPFNDFFTYSTYLTTRGHCRKLFKQQSRIDVRKFNFSNRIVDIWNNLPSEVVEATNINIFKSRLDRVPLDCYC